MCGLAGTYSRVDRDASRSFLLAMAGELYHRGPDGTGLYLDGRFGMVNTRLAIIDLAGGDQPLADESGRYWVMQNGEIYNYVELTQELEALGHRFATHVRHRVIAHAYAEWGPDCLQRLNGDFAFAVWDREEEELFLARDRFGVRPLFLAEFGGDLSFASEAKALLRHPEGRRELDPAGLVETFTAWSNLPERSAFAGIRELAPAHYMRVGPEGIREERRWWDIDFTPRAGAPRRRAADRGAPRAPLRLDPHPPARRRPRRRVPQRRPRLLRDRDARAAAHDEHALLVRARLRRRALRRERLPGPDRRRSSAPT